MLPASPRAAIALRRRTPEPRSHAGPVRTQIVRLKEIVCDKGAPDTTIYMIFEYMDHDLARPRPVPCPVPAPRGPAA